MVPGDIENFIKVFGKLSAFLGSAPPPPSPAVASNGLGIFG